MLFIDGRLCTGRIALTESPAASSADGGEKWSGAAMNLPPIFAVRMG